MPNTKTRLIAWLLAVYVVATLLLAIVLLQLSPSRSQFTEETMSVPDFTAFTDVKEKKAAFFGYFRPIVEQQNEKIRQWREDLSNITQKVESGEKLGSADRLKMKRWRKRYKIDGELDLPEQLALLNRRMQEIPPSLVLAQAANESAWGTSRFARKGHNYFGQWCFTRGCGIVPGSRNAGATHEVRKFRSPKESVLAYFRNLNTHPAYLELRKLREQLHSNNQPVTGITLAAGLERYSERGHEYVSELRSMIRTNNLQEPAE